MTPAAIAKRFEQRRAGLLDADAGEDQQHLASLRIVPRERGLLQWARARPLEEDERGLAQRGGLMFWVNERDAVLLRLDELEVARRGSETKAAAAHQRKVAGAQWEADRLRATGPKG